MKRKTIFLVGGGTGGHLLPVLAIAEEIRRQQSLITLVLILQKDGQDQEIVKQYFEGHLNLKLNKEDLEAEKFYRYFDRRLLLVPWKFIKGLQQSFRLINHYQPSVIFCKGGYLSLPVAIAGWLRKIPIILHETDAVVGIANRLIKPMAQKIAVSFPLDYLGINDRKYVYTGNPIRSEFITSNKTIINRKVKEIVIIGSSLGSHNINKLVAPIIVDLARKYKITHFCGQKDLEWLKSFKTKNYDVFDFKESIAPSIKKADLVISRAGGTIFELAALGKPTILIPLPWAAGNHQWENAKLLQKREAAVILDEKVLTPSRLLKEIRMLDKNYEFRKKLALNINSLASLDATKRVADLIIDSFKEEPKKLHYHLIGISGAAMSGLSEILKTMGYQVTGSDLKTTGHRAANVVGADRVIFSPAITPDSAGWVEIEAAQKAGIETLRYDYLLKELLVGKKLIAIAGMHGKSTTTAMVATLLEDAGLDPTVLVGASINKWQGRNWRVGKSDLWVLEADEYEKKFLSFYPDIAVVTNVEAEHLDVFGSLRGVRAAFSQFLNQVKSEGVIIAFSGSKILKEILSRNKADKKIIYYGENQQYSPKILPTLKVIGKHNQLNALAALAVADTLEIDRSVALESLKNFSGIGRRLELVGEKDGVTVIDDYGHHPTEIKASLRAIKEAYPARRLVVAFQPHQHHRTKVLFKDFASSFQDADLVLLLDVFTVPGRDTMVFVDSKDLAEAIGETGTKVHYIGTLNNLAQQIDQLVKPQDIFLTIGATDITKIGREWINQKLKIKMKNAPLHPDVHRDYVRGKQKSRKG